MLDTVLDHLSLLFHTAGPQAARQAAHQMVTAYNPATMEELALAADIVSFRLHALQALGKACEPGLSLAKVLRLRGSAVSLSREAHKSQRKLDQLQKARAAVAEAALPDQPAPRPQPKPKQSWPEPARHQQPQGTGHQPTPRHHPPDLQQAA
jgi:hypothetical protein